MSTQLQLRRGSTAQTASFIGAVAEITIDTDKNVVVVHDGVTTGGHSLALQVTAQAAFDAANNVSTDTLTNGSKSFSLKANGTIYLPAGSTLFSNIIALSTSNANQVIDTFDINQYRTVKYLIQSATDSDVHTTEVTLVQDGNSTYLSQYNDVSTTTLFTPSASITGNTVSFTVSPAFTNTTFDIVRTGMVARAITAGPNGDLMSQSGVLDMNTQSGTLDLML